MEFSGRCRVRFRRLLGAASALPRAPSPACLGEPTPCALGPVAAHHHLEGRSCGWTDSRGVLDLRRPKCTDGAGRGLSGKCGARALTSRGVDKEGSAGTGEGRGQLAKGQGGELVPRGGSNQSLGLGRRGAGQHYGSQA